MATQKSALHRLLERAHSPDTASHIFSEKIEHRELFVRPTDADQDVHVPAPSAEGAPGAARSTSTAGAPTAAGAASLAAAAAASAAAETSALSAQGHNGRDARRRARRRKQEQRLHAAKAMKPKPLSARTRKALRLYDVPTDQSTKRKKKKKLAAGQTYATFEPLHRLWLGYIREILSPQELRMGGQGAAAKLVAADLHGARVEVVRSACTSRVGLCGIVVKDARFVFEIVTPDNELKMVPKEGTFFRAEIPLEDDAVVPAEEGAADAPSAREKTPVMAFEIVGSQFMHRAIDRANRKFKQHFNKFL